MSSGTTTRVRAISGLVAVLWIACNPHDPNQLLSGSPELSSPAAGGPGAPTDARRLFKEMESELLSACKGCHGAGTNTPLLAGPDYYQTFVGWSDIVKPDPEQSLLYTFTRVGKGHTGRNLDAEDLVGTLLPKVEAWLAAEAKNFTLPPAEAGVYIDPIVPIMGFNAFYLGALGPEFNGMAVTFNAYLLTDKMLGLENIEVHPTLKMGVHIVHPIFVVHPLGEKPKPDPMDSFADVDQTFEANTSGTLGEGKLSLPGWLTDAKLSLAFEKIEVVAPASGEVVGGCKNLELFNTSAWLAFGMCFNCHGGPNSQAVAAVDMSQFDTDPAMVCAQIKNRVYPPEPSMSQIFKTTDPALVSTHPFKFGGNASMFAAFRDNVSIWVAAEQ